jgi:hypothetical protein
LSFTINLFLTTVFAKAFYGRPKAHLIGMANVAQYLKERFGSLGFIPMHYVWAIGEVRSACVLPLSRVLHLSVFCFFLDGVIRKDENACHRNGEEVKCIQSGKNVDFRPLRFTWAILSPLCPFITILEGVSFQADRKRVDLERKAGA